MPASSAGVPGRVLLVCRAYGTPDHTGSFRWRSLTRLLGERGWRFDVVSLERPSEDGPPKQGEAVARVHAVSPAWWLWRRRQRRLRAHVEREARQFEVDAARDGVVAGEPHDVPVVRTGQPFAPLEQLRRIVTTVADVADDTVWKRRAGRRMRALLARHDHDLVLATSPDPVAHDVAADLVRRSGIPFVAEFRDPRFFGRGDDAVRLDVLARRLSRRAELVTLARASAVVDIAAGAARASVRELEQVAPELAGRRRAVIPSGYEPRRVAPVDAARFRIVYTGWLWPFMPLPSFLTACGRFVGELDAGAGAAGDVSVELLGVERRFNGVPLVDIARAAGLAERFRCAPRRPRDVAARHQERAAVLVAFDSVCASGICIPSKLYHYAPCHGALLPIGEPAGAMAEEARKIGVRTFAPQDVTGIVAFLHAAYRSWSRGELTCPNDADGILGFGHRADEMDALLRTVLREAGDGGARASLGRADARGVRPASPS